MKPLWLGSLVLAMVASIAVGQENIFSGPQPGEALPRFKARGVFDELAGKEVDLVGDASGKPICLIFVHEFSRPTVGLVRLLMLYAAKRSQDGLINGVVFLDEDATEAENMLRRARHALPTQVPLLISEDGAEGPGSYGLNRMVAMTILVGKKDRVVANFALVQPSIQADAQRIAAEIAKAVGDEKPPSLEELTKAAEVAMPARGREPEMEKWEQLIRAFIRRSNDDATVDRYAAEIQKSVEANERLKVRLGEISGNIVRSGKLKDYGTAKAQEYLKQWSDKYGSASK